MLDDPKHWYTRNTYGNQRPRSQYSIIAILKVLSQWAPILTEYNSLTSCLIVKHQVLSFHESVFISPPALKSRLRLLHENPQFRQRCHIDRVRRGKDFYTPSYGFQPLAHQTRLPKWGQRGTAAPLPYAPIPQGKRASHR